MQHQLQPPRKIGSSPSTDDQLRPCMICFNASEKRIRDLSHNHYTEDCNFLHRLADLPTDNDVIRAGFRPASRIRLPPYSTLLQNKLVKDHSGSKRKSNDQGDDSVSKTDFNKLKNTLGDLVSYLKGEGNSSSAAPSLPLLPHPPSPHSLHP